MNETETKNDRRIVKRNHKLRLLHPITTQFALLFLKTKSFDFLRQMKTNLKKQKCKSFNSTLATLRKQVEIEIQKFERYSK